MTIPTPRRAPPLKACATWSLLLTLAAAAVGAPGAHGPNGEHLDAPATASLSSSLPRVEARSEGFELVAELRAGEFVIVVDRYQTNEPVLGAKLEVESGPHKALADFRAEQGDYALTDAALLKALATPGEHGLVFTLTAGSESDLLDGTLVTVAAQGPGHDRDHDHDHPHHPDLERAAWIGAGVAALGVLGGLVWWRQRRRSAGPSTGAL